MIIYKSLVTLSAFCKPLDLEFLCSLEESRKLLLCHVHLPSIHELQDGCEVGKGDVLQDDNGMLGGVLLQKVLEVWRACTEDHLVCLGMLTLVKQKHQHKKHGLKYLSSNGDVTEAFFVPQMFEGCDHVSLEVIPPQAELLVISHSGLLGVI